MAEASFILSSDGVAVDVVVNFIPNGVPAIARAAVGALDGVGTTEIMDDDGSDVRDDEVGLEPAEGANVELEPPEGARVELDPPEGASVVLEPPEGATVEGVVVTPDDGAVVGTSVKAMVGVKVGVAVAGIVVGTTDDTDSVGVAAGVIVGEVTATGEGEDDGVAATGDGDTELLVGTCVPDGVMGVGPLVDELTVGTTVDGEAGCVVRLLVGTTVSIELLDGVGAFVMLLVVGVAVVPVDVGLKVAVAEEGEEIGAVVNAGIVGRLVTEEGMLMGDRVGAGNSVLRSGAVVGNATGLGVGAPIGTLTQGTGDGRCR